MLTLQTEDERSVELHIYWEWKRGTFRSESRSRLRSVAPEAKSTPLMKSHWSMCLHIVQWNSRSPAGRGFPRLLTEIESEGQGIPPNIVANTEQCEPLPIRAGDSMKGNPMVCCDKNKPRDSLQLIDLQHCSRVATIQERKRTMRAECSPWGNPIPFALYLPDRQCTNHIIRPHIVRVNS